ncbi:MAG: plasmid recombination protein [Eubacteriaceae bacterium]|nr:plasmid recombination protein [Eubacteriaceae bacterium]
MVQVRKYARPLAFRLTRHFERAANKDGEYTKYKNQPIDLSKTNLNYNLAPEREGGQVAFIAQRLGEVHFHNRQNINVMADWLVTLPKGMDGMQELFFEETYAFLSERYGVQNVISAYVHLDELSPHMHFAFVPVGFDSNNDRLTVSVKIVLNGDEVANLPNELEAHLEEKLDYDFLKTATSKVEMVADGFSISQLKEIDNSLKESNRSLSEIVYQTEVAKAELKSLEDKKAKILDALDATSATRSKLYEFTPTKTITGAIRGITMEQIEFLKSAAIKCVTLENELASAKKIVEDSQQSVLELEAINTVLEKNPGLKSAFDAAKERYIQTGDGDGWGE